MPKFSFYRITNILDTDKLNKNFDNITDDINEAYNRLDILTAFYSQQMSNITIINQYRQLLANEMLTLDTGYQEYNTSTARAMIIDPYTADSYTTDAIDLNYGIATLRPIMQFNRFPTTFDNYGNSVPLFDSVKIQEDGVTLGTSNSAYYMLANNDKMIFIKNVGTEDIIEYILESNVSTPIVNTIEIFPVFGGLTTISNLQYGFESTWNPLSPSTFFQDPSTYPNMYGREFIFKQANNATGIKFNVQSTLIGTNKYVGFYKVGAYYRVFPETGTITFTKSINVGEYDQITNIKILYDFFSPSIKAIPNILRYVMRLRILDGLTEIYDTDGGDQYPILAPISLITGALTLEVTLKRYDEITPMLRSIVLGLNPI